MDRRLSEELEGIHRDGRPLSPEAVKALYQPKRLGRHRVTVAD